MATDRLIPTPKNPDVVSHSIKVNGSEIPMEIGVYGIEVFNQMNRVPKARLVLSDGNVAKEDFELSNNDLFKPGNEIEISLGYHSENKEVFKGIIVSQKIKVRNNRNNRLIIECRDKFYKMTTVPKSKYYYDSKNSDIIESLVGPYQLKKNVEATDHEYPEVIQYNCSDWDFMMLRAEASGKLAAIDNGELTIKAPDFGEEPLFDVLYGASLIEFDLEVNSELQPSGVTYKTWDYSGQELIETEAKEPGFDVGGDFKSDDLSGVLSDDPISLSFSEFIEESALQTMADNHLMRARLSKIQGRLQFQGNADTKPFTLLKLEGVGGHFNGKILVTGIKHQFLNGNWTTDVQFGLDPRPFAEQHNIKSVPQKTEPGISGLQTAVVTQLEEDPNGEFRILVRIPSIGLEEDGIWARVASPDAGDGRGFYFRPEIDDEVIVGFVNNNPKHAVVLGCLYSSAKPSPIEPTDDNHEKGIVTRSENKILINDDTNTITIETPAGKKVMLDEDSGDLSLEDDNGNKITMNQDGISIESAKDLILKATGDITVEGNNIDNKANLSFTADGKSGAELTTNGSAVIKGSIVQIN